MVITLSSAEANPGRFCISSLIYEGLSMSEDQIVQFGIADGSTASSISKNKEIDVSIYLAKIVMY